MAGEDDEWEFPGFAAACSSPWDKSLLGSGQWGGLLLRAPAASAGPLLAPMFPRLQVREGRRQEAGGRLQNAPASLTRPVMTISDQTTKAETILALKVVESNYSYQSCDNIFSILQAMDPDSKVFKKMSMGESKVSYTISHGLLHSS